MVVLPVAVEPVDAVALTLVLFVALLEPAVVVAVVAKVVLVVAPFTPTLLLVASLLLLLVACNVAPT